MCAEHGSFSHSGHTPILPILLKRVWLWPRRFGAHPAGNKSYAVTQRPKHPIAGRKAMGKIILKAFVSALLVLATSQAWADGHGVNCPRFTPGSVVPPPPDIYSQNGALNVQLNYFTRVDQDGRSLFCFQTPDGMEGPTLRLNPGDQLHILAANDVPAATPVEQVSNATNQCGDLEMYTSSL